MAGVRVKICGITSVADALAAVNAGADAVGLVFYEASSRYVNVEQAREISLAVGPLVTTVGLFVNASAAEVKSILCSAPLHLLQFHGDETDDFCRQFDRPFMKAVRMKPELDVTAEMAKFPSASGILLDAYRPGVPGGTGEQFDWQRVPSHTARPIVLAGGLNPDNVAAAVRLTRVYGVDVSGGVEASPGIKDTEKVATFIRRAKLETQSE